MERAMNEMPMYPRPESIEPEDDPALEAAALAVSEASQGGMGMNAARSFVRDINALLRHYVSLLPKE